MREREEGPLDFKRRQAAMTDEDREIAAKALREIEPPRPTPPVTSAKPDPYVKVAPGSNGEEVRKLYEQIEREHLKLGKLPPVTIDQLQQMVQKQSEAVRSKYQVSTVAFRVDCEFAVSTALAASGAYKSAPISSANPSARL